MFRKLGSYYPPLLELIPIGMMVFALWYVFFHYGSLPEKVPTHYGFSGAPDAWGSKGTVLLIPMISLIVYLPSFFITLWMANVEDPRRVINLSAKRLDALGPERLEGIRAFAVRSMWFINAFTVALLTSITYGSIQTARGAWQGLGWLPMVMTTGLLLVCGLMLVGLFRLSKPS